MGFYAYGMKLGLKSVATTQFPNQVFFIRIKEDKADFYTPGLFRDITVTLRCLWKNITVVFRFLA